MQESERMYPIGALNDSPRKARATAATMLLMTATFRPGPREFLMHATKWSPSLNPKWGENQIK